jgi:hypothetical protein
MGIEDYAPALSFVDWLINFLQFGGAHERDVERFGETAAEVGETRGRVSMEEVLQQTGFEQPYSYRGLNLPGIAPPEPAGGSFDIESLGKYGKYAQMVPWWQDAFDTGDPRDLATKPGRLGRGGAGGNDPGDMFTSAQAFKDWLPEGGFEPIDIEGLRFDPTELRELGARLGEDLRGGGADFGAYRQERLGEIAEATRAAQRQARQETAGSYGSLEEGATELSRRRFSGQLAAGQKASAVESAVEEMSVTDERERAIDAAKLEALLFGKGEELVAGNLPLLGVNEQFNRTFPADLARAFAQLTGVDEANAANFMQFIMSGRLGTSQAEAGYDVDLTGLLAGTRAQISEPIVPFTAGGDWRDYMLQKDAIRAGEPASQTGFGIGLPGGGGFGLQF